MIRRRIEGVFDHHKLQLNCPECKTKLRAQTLRNLKSRHRVKCRRCGHIIKVDATGLAKELRKVEKMTEDHLKQVSKIFEREITIEL